MKRLFRHYISLSLLTLLIVESSYLFCSFYIGRALYTALGHEALFPAGNEFIFSALVFSVVMCMIMTAMGLYERNFWNGKSDMMLRVGISFMLGLFVMTAIYYLSPRLYLTRDSFILIFAIAFAGVVVLRFLFFKISDNKRVGRRILVLGIGQYAKRMEELQGKTNSGLSIVGYLQLHAEEVLQVPANRLVRMTTNLSDLAENLSIDEIVVAMDDRRKGFPLDEVMECKFDGIQVSTFLSFFERQSGKIQLDALRPSNLIFSEGLQLALVNRFFKRLFDLISCSVLLVLASPLMLIAGLAVWLESGCRDPILYRQTRVGINGHPFEVVKFRSMRVDAEKDGKARWAQRGDSRITRVGAIMRDSRVDELPQLFNVLRGDMSFVGPRPERPQFVDDLAKTIPYYNLRHMVKPGITGWAQICFPYGASEEDAREKLEYDLYYIKNYSLFFDTVILLQTVHTVFWGKGAH